MSLADSDSPSARITAALRSCARGRPRGRGKAAAGGRRGEEGTVGHWGAHVAGSGAGSAPASAPAVLARRPAHRARVRASSVRPPSAPSARPAPAAHLLRLHDHKPRALRLLLRHLLALHRLGELGAKRQVRDGHVVHLRSAGAGKRQQTIRGLPRAAWPRRLLRPRPMAPLPAHGPSSCRTGPAVHLSSPSPTHQDVELGGALHERVAHRRRHLVALREQLLRLVLRHHRLEHLVADRWQHALVPVGAQVLRPWWARAGGGVLRRADAAQAGVALQWAGGAPLRSQLEHRAGQRRQQGGLTRKILGSCSTSGLDSTRSVMFTICRSAPPQQGCGRAGRSALCRAELRRRCRNCCHCRRCRRCATCTGRLLTRQRACASAGARTREQQQSSSCTQAPTHPWFR